MKNKEKRRVRRVATHGDGHATESSCSCLVFTSPRSSSSAIYSSSFPPSENNKGGTEGLKGDYFKLFAWWGVNSGSTLEREEDMAEIFISPLLHNTQTGDSLLYSFEGNAMIISPIYPHGICPYVPDWWATVVFFSLFFYTWPSYLVFLSWLSTHAACVSWWVNNMHM